MNHGPSYESNIFLSSHKIPPVLYNHKAHLPCSQQSPIVLVLSHTSLIQAILNHNLYSLLLYYPPINDYGWQVAYFLLVSPPKALLYFSTHTHMWCTSRPSYPFDLLN